ncbi:hypothetical protein SH661x_000339 [Planctomicrobium sp. SH661]|uniref:hypothetical protein n=1 Tax=Planctomicrobium sp. SH661 TaxID=3448124 RepID=UPI003F5C0F51
MDITSPALLKLKAALFLGVALIAGGLLTLQCWASVSWQFFAFYLVSIWAFCRAYYFCFYVMQHYADPGFRYTGLLDLFLYLSGFKKKPSN